MTEDHSSELLGQLPRTRPHRRSAKRPARPANGAPDTAKPTAAETRDTSKEPSGQARPKPATQRMQKSAQAKPKRTAQRRPKSASAGGKRLPQPAQPRGVPTAARRRSSQAPQKRGEERPTPVLRTAAQAAAELAEIGMTLSTRAVRRAIGRLPRP